MTTSDADALPLCTLRFSTQGRDYETNLEQLAALIDASPSGGIVLAPEVCLTNFDYDHFEAAAVFTERAHRVLCEKSADKCVILTMIERRENGIFNVARVYHQGRVLREQSKAKLFKIGGEERYFSAGPSEQIAVFECDGLRLGILICFELRFTALWEQLRGADIIFVPAQWGHLRADHFDTLGRALAIANQCYVMQSDTDNEETTGQSGIITPFGECIRDNGPIQQSRFDPGVVKKMRRYLDVGIEA